MKSSIREIARLTGYSVATVSRALRGHPSVTTDTTKRISQIAQEVGYRSSPLISAVLRSLRSKDRPRFTGSIAIAIIQREPNAEVLPFHKRQIEGAKVAAATLGFSLTVHRFVPTAARLASFSRTLRNQGIDGIIFLGVYETADLHDFDFSGLSAVQNDYPVTRPRLVTVTIDHHLTLRKALETVRTRGYKRIGLFIERAKDQRLKYRWSGAFLAYQNGEESIGNVPILEVETLTREQFLKWFRRYKPDLLMGHRADVLDWIKGESVEVPRDVGFATLNAAEVSVPCAGLDLLPEAQGAESVTAVVGQILQFENAIQRRPETIMIEGDWINGPTIRT